MIDSVVRLIREQALRRRHRNAQRKIRVIEAMDLPDDVKRAAIHRVRRRVEEALDRFTRGV